jgi:hypothetical protein
MEVYQLDTLMSETRDLAAKYRQATGQTLPVSHDLACYDAIRILNLAEPEETEASVDALDKSSEPPVKIQIKARVMFASNKGKQQRIGQLSLPGNWQRTLLVLLDEQYQTQHIYQAERTAIEAALADKPVNKRGAMTVPRFKAIAECVYDASQATNHTKTNAV